MKPFCQADLRVNLWLIFVNAIMFLICAHETSFIALFALACLWLLLRKQYKKAAGFIAAYITLCFLSEILIGIRSLTTIWFFTMFSRHLLITISYVDGLADAHTGTLLTVFERIRLPKAAGISTVVLLRFIPTIAYEYHAIRGSLKFRGVGITIRQTLLHLPKNFECTIIPLLMRTTRIAEELSAAAMVRGVRTTNKIVSFDEVHFRLSDGIICVIFSLYAIIVCLADRLNMLSF
ncbi:MAG: energy-coupling factor transporter transmembrane component T [Eubacteriales bacterium]|nr:energy-coupling factor transporter transmembrane component T [Eubacteriales bacterium]